MFAIVRIRGKQYRVQKGKFIDVDLLKVDDDASVEFDDVLLVSNEDEGGEQAEVGVPVLENYRVRGTAKSTVFGPKVYAYKFNRRKNYHRNKGHRQRYTRVEITDIEKVA